MAADFDTLTPQQQTNVICQLEVFRAMVAYGNANHVGVVDIARDALKETDTNIAAGSVHTLRTHNAFLWLLPSAEHEAEFGPRGRLLRDAEKCRCAGVVP